MKRLKTKTAMIALICTISATPSVAKVSEEDVAGALVILGAAALLHNEHHYQEGWQPNNARETADFERGYRDGLHNAEYTARDSMRAYGEGFSAGMKERDNRLAHRTQAASGKVPHDVLRGCAGGIADSLGVGIRDVHIIKSVERGPDDFLVEGAVGHKHKTCVVNGIGVVADMYDGRMQ